MSRDGINVDQKTTIFGTRNDVVVFLAVPFLLSGVLTFVLGGGLHETISPLSFFLLYVLFDHFHVYLGIGTALNFPRQTSGRALFYVGFPLLCFAIYAGALSYSTTLFYSLFAYASVFHFARQQIGWMRVSGRRGRTFYKREFLLNDLVIYASTFGFVAYRVAHAPGARWIEENDLGYLPSLNAPLILAVILAINLGYAGFQLWTLFRHRYWNSTKTMVWISTLGVWALSAVLSRQYGTLALALIVIHHAAPFVLLSLLYSKKRLSEGWRSRAGLNFKKVAIVLAAIAVGAAFTEFAIAAGWVSESVLPDGGILEPLLATFSTYHYAIDSFFWRESYNAGSMKFLDPAAPLEKFVQDNERQVS